MRADFPRTLDAFEQRFATEETCIDYLVHLRWPKGWKCPLCGGAGAWLAQRSRWRCKLCGHEMSLKAGTIFQDSHLPVAIWFRAMWLVTSLENGISASALQRAVGLANYQTARSILQRLRRVMELPGHDRLDGVVEVDTTEWSGQEAGATGRRTVAKALIIVAAQEDGSGIGRIRLRRIPDLSKAALQGFIAQAIAPGSRVKTDDLSGYMGLSGYIHDRQVQLRPGERKTLFPRAHRVISMLKTRLAIVLRSPIGIGDLDDELDRFAVAFNRLGQAFRGKLFYCLAERAMRVDRLHFHP